MEVREMPMVTDLPIANLVTRKDARRLDEAKIGEIKMSIMELGLINPLRVRKTRIEVAENQFKNGWEVTAGRHRLEALRTLGLEYVPCVEVDDDDLHAELAMIDENLCRAELSAAERARAVARRKEIFDEMRGIFKNESSPNDQENEEEANDFAAQSSNETVERKASETAQDDNVKPRSTGSYESDDGEEFEIDGNVPPPEKETAEDKEFFEKTAEQTNRSAQSVRIDNKRGSAIPEDVLKRIAGTHLDKGTYLDKLRELPPDKQRAKVEIDLDKGQEPRQKKTNNIVKINAIRKIANILLRYVPEEEHDAVEILIEESDLERLHIEWNKIRYKDEK